MFRLKRGQSRFFNKFLESLFCRGAPRAYERRVTTTLFWLLLLPLNQQEQLQGLAPDAAAPTNVSTPAGPIASKDKTSNDRLFFTLPNYFTLEKPGEALPLTADNRYFRSTETGFFRRTKHVLISALVTRSEGAETIKYAQREPGFLDKPAIP